MTDIRMDQVMLPLPNLLETVRSRWFPPLALPSLKFLRTPYEGEEPISDNADLPEDA